MNKYSREIRPGVWVDVYDVLAAFRTGCPALDHAVKKLLAPGQRGAKSREQDLEEAILSVRRSIEILATGRESGSGNAPGPEGGSTPDPAPSCTGLAAVWCPVHGDCTCERSHEYAEDDPVDTACPLHGQASDHAANEHCPDPAPLVFPDGSQWPPSASDSRQPSTSEVWEPDVAAILASSTVPMHEQLPRNLAELDNFAEQVAAQLRARIEPLLDEVTAERAALRRELEELKAQRELDDDAEYRDSLEYANRELGRKWDNLVKVTGVGATGADEVTQAIKAKLDATKTAPSPWVELTDDQIRDIATDIIRKRWGRVGGPTDAIIACRAALAASRPKGAVVWSGLAGVSSRGYVLYSDAEAFALAEKQALRPLVAGTNGALHCCFVPDASEETSR